MRGWKRQESQTESKQAAPDPAAVARAQREADALRETAERLPEIDPADAKYW